MAFGTISQPKLVFTARSLPFSHSHTMPCRVLPSLLAASLVVSHTSNSFKDGIYSPYYGSFRHVKEFTNLLYKTQVDVVEYKYQTRKHLWGLPLPRGRGRILMSEGDLAHQPPSEAKGGD